MGISLKLLATDLMLNATQAKAATNDSGWTEVMNEETNQAYLGKLVVH